MMSARKKQERKQQQRRRRKQRETAQRRKELRASTAASTMDSDVRLDEPELELLGSSVGFRDNSPRGVTELIELLAKSGAPDDDRDDPLEPTSEAEIWWGKYSNSTGATRLEMTREKLATVSPEDNEYDDFFPEAIDELESKLSGEQYVAFLEELYETRPEVFSMSADWHVRSMVFEYLAQGRLEDVDRVVMHLAKELKSVSDPFFSLMSTIRLAGREEAVRALIDNGMKCLEHSSLMYWAVNDLSEWALFAHYQRCVADGATDEAIEALHAAARKCGIEDGDGSQENRRTYALHLAGKSGKRWTKDELISNKKKAGWNIYLLGVDYQQWLCEERRFNLIVADELRHLIIDAIDGINCPFRELLTGLPHHAFDQYLAKSLGFMELARIHAPATIVAMKHYYDFLKELELVKPDSWQKSRAVCDRLWEGLKRVLDESEWKTYAFLEGYLPASSA